MVIIAFNSASPALFASSQITKNAEEAEKLSNVIFSGSNVKRTAQFKNSTLAIIRPHIFNSGQVGKVIDAILKAGFLITDLENFHLETANAEEFLEVYKDVVPEYRVPKKVITGHVGSVDGGSSCCNGNWRPKGEYCARIPRVLRSKRS